LPAIAEKAAQADALVTHIQPEIMSTGSSLLATDGRTALPFRLGSGFEKISRFWQLIVSPEFNFTGSSMASIDPAAAIRSQFLRCSATNLLCSFLHATGAAPRIISGAIGWIFDTRALSKRELTSHQC